MTEKESNQESNRYDTVPPSGFVTVDIDGRWLVFPKQMYDPWKRIEQGEIPSLFYVQYQSTPERVFERHGYWFVGPIKESYAGTIDESL